MDKKIIEKVDELIGNIIKEGININNLDNLYKLSKIKHMTKEDMEMYGRYGRTAGYNSYGRENYGGNYGNYGAGYGAYGENYGEYSEGYGRRGYDSKYRAYGHLDNMADAYGRYQESRERYGAGEETDKSFHYMVKALEDFIKVLHEEAETPQQKQMLTETLQKSMK